jgi:scyllo-inositol 2-dehydrogenase (NADP+)
VTPDPRAADERDSISHLMAVVGRQRKPNRLSSLENNVIVTEILDAARRSAQAHARVTLVGR